MPMCRLLAPLPSVTRRVQCASGYTNCLRELLEHVRRPRPLPSRGAFMCTHNRASHATQILLVQRDDTFRGAYPALHRAAPFRPLLTGHAELSVLAESKKANRG